MFPSGSRSARPRVAATDAGERRVAVGVLPVKTDPSVIGHTFTTGDGITTQPGVRLYDPYAARGPATLAIAELADSRAGPGGIRAG